MYIDGNHDYEHVKNDIQNYFPKIKKDGFIGGHDFQKTHLGVMWATTEFSSINGYKLNGDSVDWWIQK